MATQNLKSLFSDLVSKERQALEVKGVLDKTLAESVGKLFHSGKIVYLDNKSNPEYLWSARVVRGRSPSTNLFRIDRFQSVEFVSGAPHLTKWFVHATPISEKTGAELQPVVLSGRVVTCGPNETPVEANERFFACIESVRPA